MNKRIQTWHEKKQAADRFKVASAILLALGAVLFITPIIILANIL
jgi:hypothetical protein